MTHTMLVDMGNSRVKWAWHQPLPLQVHSGEYVQQGLDVLCDHLWPDDVVPQRVWVSCVTDQAQAFSDWCDKRWGLRPEFAHSTAQYAGLSNGYEQPQCLGVDRWLAMIAARALHPKEALCVFDLGTAATLDMVSADGQHLGGYIVPGLGAMQRCVQQHTGLQFAKTAADGYGRDTGAAIHLGSRRALLGMLEQALSQYRRETGVAPHVLVSGGDAPQLLPYLQQPYEWRPALVLEGLAQLAEET